MLDPAAGGLVRTTVSAVSQTRRVRAGSGNHGMCVPPMTRLGGLSGSCSCGALDGHSIDARTYDHADIDIDRLLGVSRRICRD